MENASKALLMAGGILIALLVIGALLLMFKQVGNYQRSNSDNLKESQLVDFNKEFVQYTYDNIYGYELISLVNKVYDYNEGKKDVGRNNLTYQSIAVKVKIGDNFAKKYGINGNLKAFQKGITYDLNTFYNKIKEYYEIEIEVGNTTMNTVSSYYDSIKYYENHKSEDYNKVKANGGKKIEDVIGTTAAQKIKNKAQSNGAEYLEFIEEYREYSEFKKAKFKASEPLYYDNGQIKEMSFTYVKDS